MSAVDQCACGHAVQWHHEVRGCGYHGFGSSGRCECPLTPTAAVEAIVTARVDAALSAAADAVMDVHASSTLTDDIETFYRAGLADAAAIVRARKSP